MRYLTGKNQAVALETRIYPAPEKVSNFTDFDDFSDFNYFSDAYAIDDHDKPLVDTPKPAPSILAVRTQDLDKAPLDALDQNDLLAALMNNEKLDIYD